MSLWVTYNVILNIIWTIFVDNVVRKYREVCVYCVNVIEPDLRNVD